MGSIRNITNNGSGVNLLLNHAGNDARLSPVTSGAWMKRRLIVIALLFAVSASAETIPLRPQPGVKLLGASCGGVHTSTYVTGFDSKGNVTGKVYAWTRCSRGGRGGKTKSYRSWHSMIWDLTGAPLATLPDDGIAPDPTAVETDKAGNIIRTTVTKTRFGSAYLGILETAATTPEGGG